ncbi:hypothetical protein E2562_017875, partial [Oryza meyeriana var. granulata]
VFIPLSSNFWHLIVANFKIRKLEVLCPNVKIEQVRTEAEAAIWNFKRTFKPAYPRLKLPQLSPSAFVRITIFD